jgi:hypothetical protein
MEAVVGVILLQGYPAPAVSVKRSLMMESFGTFPTNRASMCGVIIGSRPRERQPM